jgi:catechol 2,3-dioxygenase-like lactoylglutathione lyase family enzyme
MARGNLLAGSRPVAPTGDRFDENRVGLDHLSFGVMSHTELEQAMATFEAQGVPLGEIIELGSFGIYILEFRDPDNVQLELTAPIN